MAFMSGQLAAQGQSVKMSQDAQILERARAFRSRASRSASSVGTACRCS